MPYSNSSHNVIKVYGKAIDCGVVIWLEIASYRAGFFNCYS